MPVTNLISRGAKYIDFDTMLLLHGDSFTDASKHGQAVTNNGVEIVDGGRFGKGLKSTASSGWMHIAFNNPNEIFGKGEWTLDWWDNPQGYATTPYSGSLCAFFFPGLQICATGDRYGNNGHASWFYSWGGCFNQGQNVSAFTRTLGTARHFAFVKELHLYSFYVDGIKTWQAPAIGGGIYGWCRVFSYDPVTAGYNSICSEIRLSNVAKWRENFVPASEAYILEDL